MATITGTTGNDTLTGTSEADTLVAWGGQDTLLGGDGADTYQLFQPAGSHHAVIDEQATDSATDRITGTRGLYAFATGYEAWATADRVGDDLVLVLPGKPHRFHDPEYGSLTIEITDHFAGQAVEELEVFGATYRLATSGTGTSGADLIAGSGGAERIRGLAGNDYIDAASGGADTIQSGVGDDTVFAGAEAVRIATGSGNDHIYAQTGTVRLRTGTGDDHIEVADDPAQTNPGQINTGAGNDYVRAGNGASLIQSGKGHDAVRTGAGNDTVDAGQGWDTIVASGGDNLLSGGLHGDLYQLGYDAATGVRTNDWGHSIVDDGGDLLGTVVIDGVFGTTLDTVELWSDYTGADFSSAKGLFARHSIMREGNDIVIAALDASTSVTLRDQFGTSWDTQRIEDIVFHGGWWSPAEFLVTSAESADLNGWRGGHDAGNEMIFGSAANDTIWTGLGVNVVWTGDGNDRLRYEEIDVEFTNPARAIIDTVMDFDIARDRIEFTDLMDIAFGNLVIGSDGEGDATVTWDPGLGDVAAIYIELRDVAAADVTEDIFLFN